MHIICLQNACCLLINYWPLMWVEALFATRKWVEFIPSLMTLRFSKHPALCCFTASLVLSAVLVQEWEEGHLSKLRWSFVTHPPSDKICATQHACFMMSETRHSQLQNISTDAVFCLCVRFQYLNSYAGDCDLACFGCSRTCLWSNRALLEVVYLFNTIVVWTEGIINRLTKHTILLWGWENPV